ncbi:C40 family peptidase [soil metagenome]
MTGRTATGGSVRGRSRIKFGGSTTGWAPRIVPLTALAMGSLCVALFLAAGASADPGVREKEAQAQAIVAQLEELDISLGATIEAWHGANIELERIDGELDTNARHLATARKSLNVAQRRIAQRLRDLYVNGAGDSTLEVLLGSQSLDDIIARLDAIERVSSQDTRILGEVKQFRREVETRRANLKDARVEQTEVVAERAAQRQEIESRLAERQQLLSSVKDEIAELRAEEARRQAALEAQARARLAAQRLAAEQAQVLAAQQAQEAQDAQDQTIYTATPDFIDTPVPAAPPPDGTQASQVIAIAMQYLGVPYVWGGASPSQGFDCSGLTTYAFAQIGVSLPHHAATQFGYGTPVSREDLQPADLVFFHGLGHMGMYIGGDQFIHAPHTGDVVKISTFSSYSGYVGARRIL